MPFIPVPNTVQVELLYLWDGQECANVLHYGQPGLTSITDMEEAGSILVAWWDASMQTLVPSTLSLTQIKLTDLNDESAPVVEYTTGLPLAGQHASPSLPNNVSVTITKRTLLRGRSFRGRIYHPGLVEGVVTNNQVLGTHMTNLINAYEEILNLAVTAEEWNMVVVSRYADNAPRVEGISTDVIALSSDGIVDSQRRRLPGRGQ